MRGIENTQPLHPGIALRRETITGAAAIGFLAGGGVRLINELGDVQHILAGALSLWLGAIAAAVLAGIVLNLIALPALSWALPGRRLTAGTYRAAGALASGVAFAGAFVQFAPGTV